MHKPRDYDSELKALDDKAKQLRARKIEQLGELVIATGADAPSIEQLAGAMLAAADTEDAPHSDRSCGRVEKRHARAGADTLAATRKTSL